MTSRMLVLGSFLAAGLLFANEAQAYDLNSQYGAMASWLTATFRYGLDPADSTSRMLKVSTNIESPGAPSKDNFESMGKWFTSLMQDVYS